MRQLLATPEMQSVLVAFISNGFFQGAFFSLMPVILSDATRAVATATAVNGTTASAGASNVSAAGGAAAGQPPAVDTAPVIAGVIIAAAVLQIMANLWGVWVSLRYCGSHGHSAWVNLACALLTVAIAALVEISASLGGGRSGVFVALLGAIYSIAYVPSASALTVLNQSAAAYARRHGAPIGVTTALARCLFATAFGLAPAATIALYEATGQRVWVPLAVMAGLSTCAGMAFLYLARRRAHSDVMPPSKRQVEQTAPPARPVDSVTEPCAEHEGKAAAHRP